MTEWYQKKKLAGICARCGAVDERVLSGKVYCADCMQKIQVGQKQRRAYLRSQKRCIHCGKRDERTELGRSACAACAQSMKEHPAQKRCAERFKENARARREQRRAAHVCTACGGERDEAGYLMCSACRMKQREYQRTCGSERA